jgi:hypothetical protein
VAKGGGRFTGSRAPTGTVEITPYVYAQSGVVIVQGCGRSGGGLWRWRGAFGELMPGEVDVLLVGEEGDKTHSSYTGVLWFCRDEKCTTENTVQLVTDRGTPTSGTLQGFNPEIAKLRASVVQTYERGTLPGAEDARIETEVDITWDPSEARYKP